MARRVVGVPRETKDREGRVGATPGMVEALVDDGHTVLVEVSAGISSGIRDEEFAGAGAVLVETHEEVFARADMILKVKEPTPAEYDLLREGQVLFTYLHLAADKSLTCALMRIGVEAVAYETVQLDNGVLPLLIPMSEVAGRMAAQVGAHYLEATHDGGGRLLGGVPGVPGAKVVVVGGGVVGTNAAQIALGMGANVLIVDKNVDRLRYLDLVLHGRVQTLAANKQHIAAAVRDADLVIGGVLVAGAKAPNVVTADMVFSMRAGSVIVDVAIDQGGCIETSTPTCHSDPVYEVNGVIHYCVTNMPGAVPRTSTFALANATLPYVLELARLGVQEAAAQDAALAKGINVLNGQIVHAGVAEAHGLEFTPLEEALIDVRQAAIAA